MSVNIAKGYVWEGSALALMARIVDISGSAIKQADISEVTLNVYKVKTGTQIITDETVSIASTVHDALQTSAIWTVDEIGFNFKYDAEPLDDPDTLYQFEFAFTPEVGAVFHAVFQVLARGLMST